ncbi:unnamed protein product [Heligmosomoides polygyrus]|uniref:Uncharacterized protein n=1 Tax=Heligmosomoides polygyrus TaxID=6339 RepID=A0A183GIN7_HELPZ|nr:unnamed protein product [Heligmosomoides polygyrus]
MGRIIADLDRIRRAHTAPFHVVRRAPERLAVPVVVALVPTAHLFVLRLCLITVTATAGEHVNPTTILEMPPSQPGKHPRSRESSCEGTPFAWLSCQQ